MARDYNCFHRISRIIGEKYIMNEVLRNRYEILKNRQKYFVLEYDELEEAIKKQKGAENRVEYCFESQFDMDYPTDVWCEQFESATYDSTIYIYGIGHYMYLKKFVRQIEFGAAVVYEPNINRVIDFLCEDVEGILNTPKLYFITGKKRFEFLRYSLDNFLNYNNRKQLFIANIPNYSKCYDKDYEQYCNIIQAKCDNIIFEKNTQIYHEKVQSYNYLNNLFKLIHEAGIQELYDSLQGYTQYPAVIVSAGPSLDKNIKFLNEYKGNVFIVVVDAALNTLKKNCVVPDLIVTMDPKFEKINALEDEEYNNLPMIVNIISGYKLVKSHKGRKFFDVQQDNFMADITEKYNKVLPILGTGGSVANSAFSFLEFAGFKNIILIGQDLAYPNNKAHTSEAFDNEKDIDITSDKYYYVDDIYGGKVLTERNMDLYRFWFEETIRNKKGLTVIDATEGGALIKGTIIMPLREALEKYCMFPKIDFVSIINKARYSFNYDDRNEAEEEIVNAYTIVDDVIAKLNEGKKLYSKLEDLYYKRKSHTKQFANILEKIKELTNFIDHDPQMAIFDMYAAKERTNVIDSMSGNNTDDSDQISMLADAGRKMLDAYILAGDKIKEDWNKYQSELN